MPSPAVASGATPSSAIGLIEGTDQSKTGVSRLLGVPFTATTSPPLRGATCRPLVSTLKITSTPRQVAVQRS